MNTLRARYGFRRVAIRFLLVVFLSTCPAALLAADYRRSWGDVHTHTNLSDGTGTLDQLLTHARDVLHLDFVILTDHDFGFVFGDNETRDQWDYASRHMREFLNGGGKTGFLRGTDTHEGTPAARTAVLAEGLTRKAIFEALRNRRNYAVSHARIELDFQINGRRMGEEIVTREKPEIAVSVTGTAPIAEVAVIRDGSVLHRLEPNTSQVKFAYCDDTFQQSSYYYLHVIQSDEDEHGNPSHAWSSPIWVQHQRATPESDQRTATDPVVESIRGYITAVAPESSGDQEARREKIAQRRAGPIVIVHRGAWALAPENTLEAYGAAMNCGADGCEIDIRRTVDGVLVMFHDDGLERMTHALGRINQHTYAELLAFPFRSVHGAKPDTRIPTLAAVLELARQRAMLLHLDVKEPGLEEDIAKLLDAADMWDHVVEINEWNATALRKHTEAHRLPYKAFGWQEGRMDMNPERVRDGLAKPGKMIMVDDPRVAGRELKRAVLRVPLSDRLRTRLPPMVPDAASQAAPNSPSPTAYLRSLANRVNGQSLEELEKLLAADLPKRTDLEGDAAHEQRRARRILERAWAAKQIGQLGDRSARAVRLLEELVAQPSLHRDWAYSALDGAAAARSLGALGATESVPFLVRTFQAADPGLNRPVEPQTKDAYAAAADRIKREIMWVLGELPCEESKKFLRAYVAVAEAPADKSAAPLFEEATRALLRQKVTADEVQCLLRSTNPAVRGTTILVCLDDQTASRDSSLVKIMPWTRELPRAGK